MLHGFVGFVSPEASGAVLGLVDGGGETGVGRAAPRAVQVPVVRGDTQSGRRRHGRAPHREDAWGHLLDAHMIGGDQRHAGDRVGGFRVEMTGHPSREDSVQRPGGRVLRAGRPMHDQLTAGTGHRHVEQPQGLALVLSIASGDQIRAIDGVPAPNIQHAPAVGVMTAQGLVRLGREAIPAERHEHDRKLQSLADMDREYLNGFGVRLQPSRQFGCRLPSAVLGAPDLGGEPVVKTDQPRASGPLLGMQCTSDVAQVGQRPFAIGPGKHTSGECGVLLHLRDHLGDARVVQNLRPLPQKQSNLAVQLLAVQRQFVRGAAEEVGECGVPQVGAARSLHGPQQPGPLLGGIGPEHARRARHHDRHMRRRQRLLHESGLGVGVGQNRDVTRPHRPRAQPGGSRQQVDDACGDVGGDRGALGLDGREVVGCRRKSPQRHSRVSCDTVQAGCQVMGRHGTHHDVLVTKLHPAHQGIDPLHDGSIAAPVGLERGVVVCLLGGVEVAVDVGTAERVDGLLGIADQNQRPMAVERPLQNRPLGRIGVLELVDQDDLVLLAQSPAC